MSAWNLSLWTPFKLWNMDVNDQQQTPVQRKTTVSNKSTRPDSERRDLERSILVLGLLYAAGLIAIILKVAGGL